MLKTLRENFKHFKWILWLVIAIFVVFVFVDWGMGTTVPGNQDAEIAATVGGKTITRAAFVREYQARENQYRQMFKDQWKPESAKMMNLPEQVMNSLIDRELMKEEAARLGLVVADEELSQRILGLAGPEGKPLFMRDGVFMGEAAYKSLLAANNLTPAAFEAEMREQMVLEKLNRLLSSSSFVSDEEVKDEYETRNLKAKISYVLKPFEVVPPSVVTDADAEAHFKKDPNAYLAPEKRKVKYLLVENARVAGAIAVTEAEINAEYNNNMDSYRKQEEVKARHILYKFDAADPAAEAAAKAKAEAAIKKLQSGADFTALAKAESDDPTGKLNGGDLGFFSRERMVKPFSDAAFAAEIGKVVGPVKTAFGYHVIETQEKTPERIQPLFEVEKEIRATIQKARAGDEVRRLTADLQAKVAKLGKASDDDLRKLTSAAITFNETEAFARADQPAGVGYSPAFVKEAFEKKLGEIAGPVTTERGEAVLKVVEILPPGVPKFQDVKHKIIVELMKVKQESMGLEAIKQALAENGTLEALAAKLDLKIETSGEFGKNGPVGTLGSQKPLLQAVMATKAGEIGPPVALPDRGTVVFKVLERTEIDPAQLDKERAELRSSLQSQKANRTIQSMLTRRRTEVGVKTNKELLTRLAG